MPKQVRHDRKVLFSADSSMIRAKRHLADVHRSRPRMESRRGFLRLDMNEGVPGLSGDFVRRALARIDGDSLATYPEYESLRSKVAAHTRLRPESIFLSNGSDAAIKYLFDAYVSPGDRVLLTDPTFAMYQVYCRIARAKPLIVQYRQDLSFPMEEFTAQIARRPRLAVVVNPNNPTGSTVSPECLTALLKRAAKNDVLLVVDEAYHYFHPETMVAEVKNSRNLVVLRTFSKLCGMAAARLGYAAACPEIVENLRKVSPTYDVNGLAVALGERVLDSRRLIPGLVAATNAGKRYLVRKLENARIAHHAGCANFVLIRCDDRAEEVLNGLAGMGVLVGGGFAQSFLKGCIRVTVGGRKVMEEFWGKFLRVWTSRVTRE